MRNLLRAGLLFFVAATLMGQTGEWKKYKNDDGNLTVLFPGDPQDTVNPTGNGAKSHTLMSQTASGLYLVVYVNESSPQPVDEATFKVYRDAFLAGLPQCSMDTEKPASPVLPGVIGRWYHLSCTQPAKLVAEGNLYWGKNFAYAVLVMYPAASARPDGGQKFLDSFSMIDPDR